MQQCRSSYEKFSLAVTLMTSQSNDRANQNEGKWKRLHSIDGPGINRVMGPSDAIDLESPLF